MKLKKCALINDLSGFGNCSLVSQIAVMSCLGLEVHPLPTAVLSNQSEYSSFSIVDLAEYFNLFINEWKKLNVHFDALLTGYFTSESQIDYIAALRDEKTILLVDPVIGSNGKRYSGFSDSLCRKIAELSYKADMITPNRTELGIITGKKSIEDGVKFLLEKGVKNVIVTGIRDKNKIKNLIFNSNDKIEIENECHGGNFSGTGDIFSAVVLGEYLNGKNIFESVKVASDFVELCAQNTSNEDLNNGTDFTCFLKYLKGN